MGFHLARTSLALKAELRRSLAAAGVDITPEQWAVLARLWEEDGRSQKEIRQSTLKDGATVTRIVDALERKGFIERRPDLADRRARRVFLTPAGVHIKDEASAAVETVRDRVFSCLSSDEQIQMISMLQQLYGELSHETNNGTD